MFARHRVAEMTEWRVILGQAVRTRRRELGLTLTEASRAIGISRSHLNLIELGRATGISRESAGKIDAGLDFKGELLALLPTDNAPRVVSSEQMRRAEFNKAVLALAASVLFDPDRVTSAQTVDAALLDDLGSITADLTRRHHHAHPQTVLGPARAHLRYLLDLQATAATDVPGHLRPGLDRLTAKTAAIVGWVVFRSQADLVTAHAQLSLGRDYARKAGDRMLLAQLLAATSSLYSSLDLPRAGHERTSPLALGLLRAADRAAGTGAPAVRGWLAARIAEEQALFQDGRTARAALARAEATLPSCPEGDPERLFCFWDATRFPGYAGKTLLLLHDQAATDLLEAALAATAAPHPRLGVLVDLAIARTHDGHADNAVDLLVEAGRLALARGIDGFARWRLREGRLALPTTQRRAFDERLSALA